MLSLCYKTRILKIIFSYQFFTRSTRDSRLEQQGNESVTVVQKKLELKKEKEDETRLKITTMKYQISKDEES